MKRITDLRIVLALVIALAGLCWWLTTTHLPAIESLLPNGLIRIGVDGSHPPLSFFADGELTGLEVELGHTLAAEIGVTVEFQPLGFDGLYDALRTGQVDLLLSGLSPDAQRLDQVSYTQAYLNAGLVLVSSAGVDSMAELPGRVIAFEYGSEAHSELNRWTRRLAAFEQQPHISADAALDATRLGDAEAALTDFISARLYLRDHPAWLPQVSEVTVLPLSGAVRAEQGALTAHLNRALERLTERGHLDEIIDRWL